MNNSIGCQNVSIIDVPNGRIGNPLIDAVFYFKIRKYINKLRPNLVVYDQPNIVNFFIFMGVPSVCMFHGGYCNSLEKEINIFPLKNYVKRLWYRYLIRNYFIRYFNGDSNLLPLFNSLYSLSETTRCVDVQDENLLSNVIGLPVDTDLFCKDDELRKEYRDKYGVNDSDIVVSYVSNFAVKKNSHLIADVFNEGIGEGVVLFGVGRKVKSDSDAFEKFFEKNKSSKRVYEVNYNDVNAYYNMSDILISLSETETFGYTIAEGMAAEKAHVVFKKGAQAEYIDPSSGMLSDDANRFRANLKILICDESRRISMGKKARDIVVNSYSFDAFFQSFNSVIKDKYSIDFE